MDFTKTNFVKAKRDLQILLGGPNRAPEFRQKVTVDFRAGYVYIETARVQWFVSYAALDALLEDPNLVERLRYQLERRQQEPGQGPQFENADDWVTKSGLRWRIGIVRNEKLDKDTIHISYNGEYIDPEQLP